MTTFDDIMQAGRLDEKTIRVRGLEFKIRPLTIADASRLGAVQKKAEAGECEAVDAILLVIKSAVVDPVLTDDQLRKMRDCNAEFIRELSEEITKAVRYDAETAAKN